MRFLPSGRHAAKGAPAAATTLAEGAADHVMPGFIAVAEALAQQSSPLEACAVAGHDLARDGASLQEAMDGLRETWQAVRGCDPEYDATAELLRSWSDTSLAFLHQISCEDPLTGLSTLAHLRSSISALFRAGAHGEARPQDAYALVVVDLPDDRHGAHRRAPDVLARALRVARLGESVRTVFPGSEVIGRMSGNRVAVLARREPKLGVRVRLLRRLVDGPELEGQSCRVWIEGIPATDSGVGLLLDELARS